MLTKGNKTKQFIISESKKLFSKQGYATVTMKDVCLACNLSRGGLYRYFGSTKDIFLQILNEDKEDKSVFLAKCINENVSASKILKSFFEDRKETLILGNSKGFSFAVQEFTRKELDQKKYLKERFKQAKKGLILILECGQRQGEFKIFDNESMALTILLFLDSLEVNTYTLGFTEKEVDEQLNFLFGVLKI